MSSKKLRKQEGKKHGTKKLKVLEQRLEDLKTMFEPGSGFGDPGARRNAELNVWLTLGELEIEKQIKLRRIELLGFVFVVVQTVLAVLTFLKK